MNKQHLVIKPFQRAHQEAARWLILKGLGERWGRIDETINPDLDDIATTFASGTFLTAWLGETLVGTGGLLPESERTYRVVRMSVEHTYRRLGIGTKILDALVHFAQSHGATTIVLETTSNWTDAIAFYVRYGFRVTHISEEDTHFILPLKNSHHTSGSKR